MSFSATFWSGFYKVCFRLVSLGWKSPHKSISGLWQNSNKPNHWSPEVCSANATWQLQRLKHLYVNTPECENVKMESLNHLFKKKKNMQHTKQYAFYIKTLHIRRITRRMKCTVKKTNTFFEGLCVHKDQVLCLHRENRWQTYFPVMSA